MYIAQEIEWVTIFLYHRVYVEWNCLITKLLHTKITTEGKIFLDFIDRSAMVDEDSLNFAFLYGGSHFEKLCLKIGVNHDFLTSSNTIRLPL